MTTKSKIITNLLVIPLMASTVFLASPALAADRTRASGTEIRHKTNVPKMKRGIAGTVVSVNGSIIVVTTKEDVQYTVDASSATIMKASDDPKENPSVVGVSGIEVGDTLFVRGKITDQEIDAENIMEGKMPFKKAKHHFRHHKNI